MRPAVEAVLHSAMRYLPIGWTSALGSALVRINVRFNEPRIAENARQNVRRHLPHLSDAEVDRFVFRFLDSVGRVMAEFSVLDRMTKPGRMEFVGVEEVRATVGKVPTLALVLHVGNWEAFAPGAQQLGFEVATFYEPPIDPIRRRIVEDSRRQFGIRLLSPDGRGLRDALALLRQNGTVAIFADEARAGKTMAPLFGRPPHLKGNLAIAARLARHVGAQLVVTYTERYDQTRFKLVFEKPTRLPEPAGTELDDVALLNGMIEPLILKYLDRWYFLDDSIAPLE